jgi:hypothetical protein
MDALPQLDPNAPEPPAAPTRAAPRRPPRRAAA